MHAINGFWRFITTTALLLNVCTASDLESVTFTRPDGFTVEKFTAGAGMWTAPTGITSVQYLVVGGGGQGGSFTGGGGGAGGFLTGAKTVTPGDSYIIVVGAGGAGGDQAGVSGENSVFGELIALGGGGGGCRIAADSGPRAGGSGGGGAWSVNVLGAPGTSGQGNSGGDGYGDPPYTCGGGGGAGGVGAAADDAGAGAGGAGLSSVITGAVVWYSGGGGGGVISLPAGGAGGSGIGGAGGGWNLDPGQGAPNTGSGGGGKGQTGAAGLGCGGSGVVIIAYHNSAQQYTVTFNSNGGSDVTSQLVASGNTALQPVDPTRAGYTFFRWCSDSDLTTAFNFSTPVTSDMTLYAAWVINVYSVNFNSNGGSDVDGQMVLHGNTATPPTSPTKGGYDFAGWYADQGLTNAFSFTTAITANTVLYAKWNVHLDYVTTTRTGGYTVVKFRSGVGTWTVPSGVTNVEYLIVGGGGGGGAYTGGGGGAGGYLTGTKSVTPGTSHAIAIGAGGAGAEGISYDGQAGFNGGDSVFGVMTAIGGGGGGCNVGSVAPHSGGCGGGAPCSISIFGAAGTKGQGYPGGNGFEGPVWASGGGGGAGGVGGTGTASAAGGGGIGRSSSITGVKVWYAGGGGGGVFSLPSGGVGGSGVGGAGAGSNYIAGNGFANTGSGGGGMGGNGYGTAGSGGSGVVILAYKAPGYEAWAAAQSPPLLGGPGAVGNDGLSNLLVYALALNTYGTNGSPGVLTGNLLAFTKRAVAVANGDVTYAIQESDDLGVTDPWTEVAAYAQNDASTISCVLPPGKGKTFLRLVIRKN